MISNLKEFKNNQPANHNFGAWSAFINELGFFRDGKGGERVGNYLFSLLKGFEKGLSSNDNIKHANMIYFKIWGENKLFTTGNLS